jgi:hypothetical protein
VPLRSGAGRQDGGDSSAAADAHYRRMIHADPANSLLLGNYSRFLRDVQPDAARAQEYCERAILANPADADALALYAGLVWETTADAARADHYYGRATRLVLTSPRTSFLHTVAALTYQSIDDADNDGGLASAAAAMPWARTPASCGTPRRAMMMTAATPTSRRLRRFRVRRSFRRPSQRHLRRTPTFQHLPLE